jgi:hypothetical protein
MKTVFSNSMLCHTWANQLQNFGKGSSMYFEGNTIYSYGKHYEIAQIIEAPNLTKVFFVNSNGYSNTTAKHTNHVWRAIPDNFPVFKIPFKIGSSYYSGSRTHSFKVEYLPEIINAMLLDVQNTLTQQINARTYFGHFSAASQKFDDIVNISELFNLPVPVRPSNFLDAQIKAQHLRETQSIREEKKQAKELQKNLELLAKWLNHEYNGQLYNIPVHLRVSKDGKLIETTKGAKVDFSAALRLLSKLRNSEDVNGYKIDGFTVLENNHKSVKIGCHQIDWQIINDLKIG